MKTKEFLKRSKGAHEYAAQLLSYGHDMADVWDALVKGRQYYGLVWVADRPGVLALPQRILLVCRGVRETPVDDGRYTWDIITDARSRAAVAMAERYARGEITAVLLEAAHRCAKAASDWARCSGWMRHQYAYYAAAQATAPTPCIARVFDHLAHASGINAATEAHTRMIAELPNPFKKGK